ncbi:MAG: ABC transporter ATP-binding protein [Synergistaceae bacterium]|jgi:ABC-type branched-subunit amino acid transport system ATPase component|nr:ABC transporter ATP-binding protein [Synergistaceae bacterium]
MTAPGPTSLLEVRGLSRSFGGIRAVEALSFDVARGGIMGLIGPNGAGKTTVFNLITGVYRPTAGTIFLNGIDLTKKRPHEVVRAGIARTFQNIRLFNRMTCLENVMTPLLARGDAALGAFFRTPFVRGEERKARETALAVMEDMGLADTAYRLASTLPYGLQRKLEIARALACGLLVQGPRLVLLDEPAAGMNEAETRELGEVILKTQKDFDVTMMLIEHHINLVMNVCTRIVVMERGTLLAEGSPHAIRSDERVIAAYLGRKGKNEHGR